MTSKDINSSQYIVTKAQAENLEKLSLAVTEIETAMERTFLVTSGLRSPQDQARINPAVKNSAHCEGAAVDVSDVDGSIYNFCIDNVDILIRLGLYLECKTFTRRWCHMQVRAPKSGHRFFQP